MDISFIGIVFKKLLTVNIQPILRIDGQHMTYINIPPLAAGLKIEK